MELLTNSIVVDDAISFPTPIITHTEESLNLRLISAFWDKIRL
jgi:diphthamide synthase subunit DPH2